MTRFHVVVRGRVQGVGFRWYVRESARDLGLAGWVRNRPDGSVEVAVEGDDHSVKSMRDALVRGPAGASVTGLDELDASSDALERPFTILR